MERDNRVVFDTLKFLSNFNSLGQLLLKTTRIILTKRLILSADSFRVNRFSNICF